MLLHSGFTYLGNLVPFLFLSTLPLFHHIYFLSLSPALRNMDFSKSTEKCIILIVSVICSCSSSL